MSICIFTKKKKKKKPTTYDDSWFCHGRAENEFDLKLWDNLHWRKINIDPWCEFCCQQSESVAHLLWECPFASYVQALCRGKIQKYSNHVQDFFMLFRWLIDRLSQQELEQWAVTKAIWNAWNKYFFEHIQTHH